MLKRKFLWLFISIWIGAVIQSQAQNADSLYVHMSDGAMESFKLDNIRKITFASEYMQLYLTNGGALGAYYGDIAKLTFALPQTSGTNTSFRETVKVYWEALSDNIVVKSPSTVATINLFDMQGVLLQRLQPRSTEALLSLSTYPVGIYILQLSNEQAVTTHKILKR